VHEYNSGDKERDQLMEVADYSVCLYGIDGILGQLDGVSDIFLSRRPPLEIMVGKPNLIVVICYSNQFISIAKYKG